MKKTKEIHNVWMDFSKLPKEFPLHKFMRRSFIGKWHYHYENKNGRIGLVRLNHPLDFTKQDGHHWEACGVLDFARFRTKKQAEIAIYKALEENLE